MRVGEVGEMADIIIITVDEGLWLGKILNADINLWPSLERGEFSFFFSALWWKGQSLFIHSFVQ